METYLCFVCGFDKLYEPPRSDNGGGSYEICPSCGFQYGVTDDDEEYDYITWRKMWIDQGMPWCSVGREPPDNWDAFSQLHRVERK